MTFTDFIENGFMFIWSWRIGDMKLGHSDATIVNNIHQKIANLSHLYEYTFFFIRYEHGSKVFLGRGLDSSPYLDLTLNPVCI
jgi:hypothetical protein